MGTVYVFAFEYVQTLILLVKFVTCKSPAFQSISIFTLAKELSSSTTAVYASICFLYTVCYE